MLNLDLLGPSLVLFVIWAAFSQMLQLLYSKVCVFVQCFPWLFNFSLFRAPVSLPIHPSHPFFSLPLSFCSFAVSVLGFAGNRQMSLCSLGIYLFCEENSENPRIWLHILIWCWRIKAGKRECSWWSSLRKVVEVKCHTSCGDKSDVGQISKLSWKRVDPREQDS